MAEGSLDTPIFDTYPRTEREMQSTKVLLEFLVERCPDDVYTPARQHVLDNWPNIHPVLEPTDRRTHKGLPETRTE